MKIEIVERNIVALSDGRSMSLHPGVIDCEEKLAKELIGAGYAKKPSPPKKKPILKEEETD